MIEHYEEEIKKYQERVKGKNLNEKEKPLFILKKLVNFGKLMDRNVYENFLKRFGLYISENEKENLPDLNSLIKIRLDLINNL